MGANQIQALHSKVEKETVIYLTPAHVSGYLCRFVHIISITMLKHMHSICTYSIHWSHQDRLGRRWWSWHPGVHRQGPKGASSCINKGYEYSHWDLIGIDWHLQEIPCKSSVGRRLHIYFVELKLLATT